MKNYGICIIICLFIFSCGKRQNNSEQTSVNSEILLNREKDALVLINNIASFCKIDGNNTLFEYKDYCGGLYIDEFKNVVVIIVGDTALHRKEIAKKIGRNDFIIQSGKYSYTMLRSILNELVSFYQNVNNDSIIQEVGLKRFGLSVQKNSIYIKLKDCNKIKISIFKEKIMNSPVFEFENSPGPAVME